MIKTDKAIENLLLATINIMTENKCKFVVLPEGNFFSKFMNCRFVVCSSVTGLCYIQQDGTYKQITTNRPFVDLRLYTSLFDGVYQCVCECDGTKEAIRMKYEDFLADNGKKPNVAYVYMETPYALTKDDGQPKAILIGENAIEKCLHEGDYENFADDIDELVDTASCPNMNYIITGIDKFDYLENP